VPSSANPTPAPWDFFNQGQFPINYDTDFDPSAIPLTTYTYAKTHDKAGYAILNSSFLNDRLYAILGARYNRADSQTTNYLVNAATTNSVGGKATVSKTTPQAGVGFKVLPDLLVYGSYSQSFVQSQAFLQVNSQPGVAAKPTTSEGYELGVKTDLFGGRVSSTVALYQIEQKDRVLRFNTFSPTGATLTNELQGTLDRSRGIEAEVTYSPIDNWQIYASAAEDDVRVKNVPPGLEVYLGEHPEGTVKTLANLWTRYTFVNDPVKGLWVGGGVNYTGRKAQRTNNPLLFLPSTTLWNAAVGYDFKWQKFQNTVTLNWDNISNIEYYPANQQRGLPERILLTLTTRF
jgi:iron complex outermembrane receptor protein